MAHDNTYGIGLLRLAQSGDKMAEEQLIVWIKETQMRRRIGKYLHKNRQVEDEDLIQEFLIGVALNIHRADTEVGDPIEYIINQGVYKVRSYLRKNILQSTSQICGDCGHITRLNRVDNHYICKRCGGTNITTRETNEYDEEFIMNIATSEIEDYVVSEEILKAFENTLDENTNVYNLYMLIKGGVNRDNPNIKNYIKTISTMWGGCSQQNVVQVMDKLKKKINDFARENNLDIIDNKFIQR